MPQERSKCHGGSQEDALEGREGPAVKLEDEAFEMGKYLDGQATQCVLGESGMARLVLCASLPELCHL